MIFMVVFFFLFVFKKGEERIPDIIDFIATEVAPRKMKKVTTPVFVCSDVEAEEVEDVTSSLANTSPCLYLFFTKNGAFEFARIAGDRNVIDCKCNDVELAVLTFIASFFVFHVGYPTDYKHLLGFLQQTLLMVPYVEKGEERKNFLMKVDGAMEEMAESCKFKKFAL